MTPKTFQRRTKEHPIKQKLGSQRPTQPNLSEVSIKSGEDYALLVNEHLVVDPVSTIPPIHKWEAADSVAQYYSDALMADSECYRYVDIISVM